MPRQTEMYSDVEQELRDDFAKQEQENARLADAYQRECEKVAELQRSISSQGGKLDELLSLVELNKTILNSVACAFIAYVLGVGIEGTPEESFRPWYIVMSVFRLLAELLFLIWCLSINKQEGTKALGKKLALWMVGWSVCLALAATFHKYDPNLIIRLVDGGFPSNWWVPIYPIRGVEFWINLMLLVGIADLTTSCAITKWVVMKIAELSDRVRGWTS